MSAERARPTGRDDGRDLPAALAWALVAALVAWSSWERWRLLSESPFPLGVDGYFYPVQLRSLLATGQLQYPASPLTFYLLAPFAAATDPLTGAKLGAAVLGALVAVPAFGLGARLGGGRGAGLLAAVLATTSAGSTYMTIEFVKNGVGLTVALAAVWAALAALDRPTRARVLVGVGAALAAAATHKMAAAVALGVIVPAALATARARGQLAGRRAATAALAVIALAVAVLAIGVVAPQRLLSPADIAQLGGLVGDHARWDLPALVGPQSALAMGHEPLVGGLLALVAVAAVIRRRLPGTAGERAAVIALAAWALGIALPWLAVDDPQGLGFRLRVAAFVPLTLLAPAVLRAAVGARPWATTALALALAVALPRPAARADGRVVMHPALVSAALALTDQVPRDATLIIPERHIAFMVAWVTGAPVALRPEAVPYARRYRLLPLSYIGLGSPLDHALTDARHEPALEPPLGLHARHRNGLVLVAEPTWDWAMTRLPERDRRYFAAWPTL